MLDFLSDTQKNYMAFRVTGNWSLSTYECLYSKLSERFSQYGSLYVYEELSDFDFFAFLSTYIGIIMTLNTARLYI